MAIRFGTSGWRAIIADEFTFAGVRRVTRAICQHLRGGGSAGDAAIIVGYDTRFLGERFAAECVKEVAAQGFRALLCNHPTPTPTISHAIRTERAAGGINFTASHNPPEYNGMKFSTADGAPALPEITRHVEQLIGELQAVSEGAEAASTGSNFESYDPRPSYLDDLARKVRFEEIARAGGRYAYDPLWGTGRGYLDEALRMHGVEVETIHDWRDVMFGGRSPEPESSHLDELREAVSKNGCALGLATDGDGDRFGVVDGNGVFVTPNQLIALLFDYLAESRGWTGGVARSVATSHLVDRVAKARSLPVYETPVGFKFIGELINEDKIILGGEESAGISIKGHYPEKDGILACLLAAEAVAARGASLSEQLAALYERVGRLESGRIGVRLTPELVVSLPEKLKEEPTEIGGRRVERVNRMDGVKFIFADGSWLLMRPSGTEPLVRIYAESESDQTLEELLNHGRKFILG
ncbi:MAG TPA: phosphoglucomutase/phosphomannomutase family protein [Pyrinomonadaceae bacterium]|jgi:phosphoglucomutase|nr:phosphoglucomutase/phosphomannomutase family protein [Pyrinomonadaceae bacterium]